jgi:hypothetical protein
MVDTETTPKPSLTAHDRCCATANGTEAAQVIVTIGEGEPLLFCGHHYDKHAAALDTFGAVVIDTRNTTPTNRQQGDHQ